MFGQWKEICFVVLIAYAVIGNAETSDTLQEQVNGDLESSKFTHSSVQAQVHFDSNFFEKVHLDNSQYKLSETISFSIDAPRALEFGIRGAAMFGPGDPTNDMLGAGFFARVQMTPQWTLGIGFDQLNFDVETPIDAVGLRAPEEDADGMSDSLSGWVERSGTINDHFKWFLGAGASYASLSVGEVTGMTNEGDPYHLINDISSEFTLLGEAGIRFKLFGSLSFEAAARTQQHFGDWEFQEVNSGRDGTIDNYRTIGLWLGISIRIR